MATVISFVSGRGGVGKTSTSLSLAKLLSSLSKKKVLLIDFDLATHGASHFFRKEIEEKAPKENKESEPKKGIVDKLASSKEDKKQLKEFVESNLISSEKVEFDFIPSTSFSTENRPDYANLPEYSSYFHPLIDSIVKWGQEYDFILIDAQAGANPCSSYAIQSSNKVVFVVHPDPLCVGATYSLGATFRQILPEESFKITEQSLENLKLESVPDDVLEKLQSLKNQEFIGEEKFLGILKETIGDEQTVSFKSLVLKQAGKKNTFCLYNFLQKEESKSYSVIELPYFKDLRPLPYDEGVYTSLKLSEIPFDEDKPTAFSLGIMRVAQDLCNMEFEQYRNIVKEKLEEINLHLESSWKRLTKIFIGILIVIFFLLGGGYISAFFLREKISSISLAAFLIGINTFCLFTGIWLAIESIRSMRGPDAVSEEAIFHLKAEQRKYQTLENTMKITDTDKTTKLKGD